MVQLALAAALMAAFLVYTVTETGRRRMIRSLHRGSQLRLFSGSVALVLCLANIACLLASAPTLPSQIVGSTTLIAITVGAVLFHRSRHAAKMQEPATQRILAIGAHPDDLELACGGTLAKLADAGYEVHALVMSDGQVGGDRSRRPSEARDGGAFLGMTTVDVRDLPDTELGTHSNRMVTAIEAKVRELAPAVIFTHSEHDQHQDHHAVHLATLRAARQHSSILCFESPSVTRRFNPSVYIDIQNYVEIKIHAIQRHRDQAGKPYMTGERVRGTAAFRGGQAKTMYAEGFEPVRLLADLPVIMTDAPAVRSDAPALVTDVPSIPAAPAPGPPVPVAAPAAKADSPAVMA